ncbi:MAG: hypothetical protein KH812_21085, partial [Proteus hauseri]|nr:hypothetical protein [Proteus hauseri]
MTLQDNVIVSTLGGYNHGLVVTGENTAATVNNSKITATGSYSNAIKAQDKATVELSGSEILAGGGASTTNPTAALYGTDGATLKVKDNSTLTALGIASHGVFLSGEGSQLEFEDSSVSIAGKQAYAITLKEGATASIKKGTVVVDSDDKSTNGSAIFVDGQKSAAKVVDTSIYTSGKSNYGIRTLNGAHAEMQSGSIKTEGEHAVGLYATGVAGQSISSITAEHITIETSGEGGAYGAVANNYSRVKLNDVTIITKGSGVSSVESGGHGLSARMSDAILEATNATIQTSGVRAYGAAVDDGGQITLLNSSVTTQGEYSTGLYNGVDPQGTEDTTLVVKNTSVITSGHLGHGASVAQSDKDAKAFLSISQSTISTRGDDSHGLNVVSGGQLFFSESQATTEGKNSYGIHIKKSNTGTAIKESVARIENSFIETLGENAHAAGLFQGGTLDLEKSVLSAQGAGSSALMINTLEGQSAQVNVENSQLINKNSAVINVLGKADISFTGSIISGDDHWLSVGETDDLSSQANSHASIKLSNSQADGATAKAALSDSSLTLSENSVWNMSGDSDLSTLINSHSFVNFSAPGDNGYKTLTVNHYHGDNGVVSLNTHLYDDASPSDKIVIDGGVADGKTSLLINNTGGAGALTRGNGIKVVDAINDGTTTSDAFSLQKKVKAGPYEYTLHRSGVKGSDDEAWFLRSTRDFHKPGEDIVIPPPPDPDPGTGPVKEPEKDPVKDPGKGTETDPGKNTGGDPVRPVEPVTPAKPVTSPAKGDVIPNYRAETSLYQDIPQLALRYSRMLVDTLHERVGEEAQVQQDNIQDNEDTSMSWGRVIYKDGRSTRDGMKSDFRLSAIQLGIDLYRQQNGDGSKSQAGISGSLGRITSDVKHTDNSVAGGNTL